MCRLRGLAECRSLRQTFDGLILAEDRSPVAIRALRGPSAHSRLMCCAAAIAHDPGEHHGDTRENPQAVHHAARWERLPNVPVSI